MTNLLLGFVAALVWGAAYGGYFAPELSRWWRRRTRRRGVIHVMPLPPLHAQRRPTARARPQPYPTSPAHPPTVPDRAGNVVPFRRK